MYFLPKKGKTTIYTFLVITLLLSVATLVNPGSGWVPPSPGTWVYIHPTPKIASVGETFTINVNVFNVTNLYGFEFSLVYNSTVLDGLSVELPSGHFLTPVNPEKIYIQVLDVNDAYNATHGIVNATVMLLAPEQPRSGSGTFVTITFKATALGECDLDLGRMDIEWGPYGAVLVFFPDKMNLGDPDGNPIDHEVVDGHFSDIPKPWVYVDPKSIVPPPALIPGENFTVNVNVFNITKLHRAEFKLGYNTTLLDAINVTEGDFLKNIGTTNFTLNINKTLGILSVNVTLVDPTAEATTTGNETLATVTFNVTTIGECDLNLYGTNLTDPTATPIDHYTFDGYFSNKAIIHDVAITNVTTAPISTVYAGKNVTITVSVKNNGTEIETLDVTTYYDNTTINTRELPSVLAGASGTLEFIWSTEGVAPGNYTIWAEASTVPGENNTANNKFIKEGKLRVLPSEEAEFVFPIEIVAVIVIIIIVAIATTIFYRRKRRRA